MSVDKKGGTTESWKEGDDENKQRVRVIKKSDRNNVRKKNPKP